MSKPRLLNDLVAGLTKDALGRKSPLFGKMLAEWTHIAGAEIAAHAAPVELKFARKNGPHGQAVLHLAVRPSFALELSYQKPLLIERLNMFFGYSAIKDIKIIQNSDVMSKKLLPATPMRKLNPTEEAVIDRKVAAIAENDLQAALKNLGKAIISRQNTTDSKGP